MTDNPSLIAHFRQQQALEEESARQGLYGLASGTTKHDVIIAKMERGAAHVLQLRAQGRHEEAIALMLSDPWGLAQEEVAHG